jgi:hypothetical protein
MSTTYDAASSRIASVIIGESGRELRVRLWCLRFPAPHVDQSQADDDHDSSDDHTGRLLPPEAAIITNTDRVCERGEDKKYRTDDKQPRQRASDPSSLLPGLDATPKPLR